MNEFEDRGYNAGYRAVSSFWGTNPASLVKKILVRQDVKGFCVLDLGAGEGKNTNAFAKAGASVVAIETSFDAIQNGRRLFPDPSIRWINADFLGMAIDTDACDIVVSYGVLHCMRNRSEFETAISIMRRATKPGGINIICAFNDRSQDLSAHPGFSPLLLRHEDYVSYYRDWQLTEISDTDLHETHPHNNLPHTHSLTRMIACRPM